MRAVPTVACAQLLSLAVPGRNPDWALEQVELSPVHALRKRCALRGVLPFSPVSLPVGKEPVYIGRLQSCDKEVR